MKARKEHRVPLSRRALAIITEATGGETACGDYVFRGGKQGPLSNMAMATVLRRMKRSGITVHGFQNGFLSSWRKACTKAGIVGLRFNDLRGTAVTRLALVGCSEPQIASITGHSLRDVRSILDRHYLHRDPALAMDAIRRLERNVFATNSPD
jgi:integrase